MTDKQTVAGAYAKIDAHEDICAVRYAAIGDSITELKSALHDLKGLAWWIIKGGVAVGFALMAWMAVQLYTNYTARLTALESPPAVTAGHR